jgi:DNA helicase II / ATP-dependent DNA helicase PcrA
MQIQFCTMHALLPDTLSDEQAAVVAHRGGPLLVAAGAGSGKTHTLAARVAALVLQGQDPQRILLLSFARRAAALLERRIGQAVHRTLGLPASTQPPRLLWCGTFHSVGARLLRRHAAALGLSPNFGVLDRSDAEELMGQQRQALLSAAPGLPLRRFPLVTTCMALYSRSVNTGEALADTLRDHFPWCLHWQTELTTLFTRYASEKQRQQLLDYDDLLLLWQGALSHPAAASALAGHFDHVLVDEYQDTNALQQAIVRGMSPTGQGLVAVGDDAQAIYAFRGASVRGMLDFGQHFGPGSQVLRLQANHRSTAPVLAAAQAVIEQAAERIDKRLLPLRVGGLRPLLVHVEDEAAEAAWVADEVLRQLEQGIALRRQAVLFRTSRHSAVLELELARRRIPFVKFGGLRFLEAAHIKDVLSLLRWVSQPRHELAGLRAARLVPGLGPATAARLVQAMASHTEPPQALLEFKAPARVDASWPAWQALYGALATGALPWPQQLAQVLAWYQPQLERLYADAAVRAIDLRQLAALAAQHGSRERFLTEMAIDPPEATSDEARDPSLEEDWLILSTIHAAKGQEWSAVNVLRVVDGCMPADLATGDAAQIEEERRLLYVAMTRARDHLALLVPQRFHVTEQHPHGDRHLYGGLSRFVPPVVQQHFELRLPLSPPASTGEGSLTTPWLDLAGLGAARWAQPGSGPK